METAYLVIIAILVFLVIALTAALVLVSNRGMTETSKALPAGALDAVFQFVGSVLGGVAYPFAKSLTPRTPGDEQSIESGLKLLATLGGYDVVPDGNGLKLVKAPHADPAAPPVVRDTPSSLAG